MLSRKHQAARTTYIPALLPIRHQPHSSHRDLKQGSTHGDLPMGKEAVPRVQRCARYSIHRDGLPIAAEHVLVALPSLLTSSPPDHLYIRPPSPPPQSPSPARGPPPMGRHQREEVHGGRSGQRSDWYGWAPCCAMVGDGDRIERTEDGVVPREGSEKKERGPPKE